MKLELLRTYFAKGTNGILLYNEAPLCATIELPWKNNRARISCIPEGAYALVKRYSPHFKWHVEVQDVPQRQLILMHPANNALTELKGCIAPVSLITGIGKGAASVRALQQITRLVFPALEGGEPVFLIIKKKANENNYQKNEQTDSKIF